MKKSIVVRGPVLSRSGYGEQARFAIRALRAYEDYFDIYIIPTNWGKCGWVWEENEERQWMDKRIGDTVVYTQQGGKFDMSLQVTIPNEWEKLAPINVGYTAGIETTKIAPGWIEKAFLMDRIVVVSNHAKDIYENTTYQAQDKNTGQIINDFRCQTPIQVVNYPVRAIGKPEDLPLELETDFNFLVTSQWGPRKNIDNTIKWFVEEFHDQEVGLVAKLSWHNDSVNDRVRTEKRLKSLLSNYKDRKCKIYLLHGSLKDNEMASLYCHPKIKAYVTLTHGEGFGLPIFEAAYHGLPVLAPDWSGHLDFLYMPVKDKKSKKEKMKAMFTKVDYKLAPIPKEAVWDGVLQEDSQWCYPDGGSYKMKLREMRSNYQHKKKQAEKLQKWILENFEESKMYKQMAEAIFGEKLHLVENPDYIFVSDIFAEQYAGGAELSLQSLIDTCGSKDILKVSSKSVSEQMLEKYKNSKWIFGNIADVDNQTIEAISSLEGLKYYFVEFDYKFCEYRNPALFEFLEDEKCDYMSTERAKAIDKFAKNSQKTFFMSDAQRKIYDDCLGDYSDDKNVVLSSVFHDGFFDSIKQLRESEEYKNKKGWIVLGSRSWVKGAADSEKWCKDNNLDYEVVFGIPYEEMLKKLAGAEGVCFKPTGLDTCPRFIIESKLLGCNLEINENVQHMDESWFATDDLESIENYLKGRTSHFWSLVNINE